MPLVALADSGKRDRDDRTILATDTAGNLLSFSSDNPRKTRSKRITGLPAMVTIKASTSDRPQVTCTRSAAIASSIA